MFDPLLTEAASAVLVIERLGQLTFVAADACTEPSFVADAVAVFGNAPQLAFAVPLVTWTLAEAPDARVPKLQVSVWLGAEPVIEHAALAGLIDQLTPAAPGSGSL
ncbi:MAG TPA: hypothetical protein VHJ79_11665, partial [Mycobacterium sp.]|nr:hypothetical protein [Mycobacterium sp.]